MVKTIQKSFSLEMVERFQKKLFMKHWGLEYYIVYINHDLVLTLTYFTGSGKKASYAFECGKTVKMSFEGKNLQEMSKWTENL